MCQVLEVSRSAYYDWLKRPESNRKKALNKSSIRKKRNKSWEK
jgi:hypothetical protein